MRWLAKFIYFKLLGWKLVGNTSFSKDTIKKAVVIAVPHTSWHDFYIGVLIRKISGVKTNFVGKKELFKWPLGWYFKAVGGRPIDRTPGQNKVEAIARLFNENEEFKSDFNILKIDVGKIEYSAICFRSLKMKENKVFSAFIPLI